MELLLDSNVLIRLANLADPQHALAVAATDKLQLNGDKLCIVPQNIYEFWSVGTRPALQNGLGLTATQVQNEVSRFKRYFPILEELPTVFGEWEKLVATHAMVGKNVHDAHLVAAMIVHGITHVLTFNKQDFQRFNNIAVLTPADVMAVP